MKCICHHSEMSEPSRESAAAGHRAWSLGPAAVLVLALALGLAPTCASQPSADRGGVERAPIEATAADRTTSEEQAERRAAAVALCQPIRNWVNAAADAVNAATEAVGRTTDPLERAQRVLDGYDAVIALTMTYQETVATLEITGTPDGARAAGDLRTGAATAVEIARSERARFEAATGTGIGDGDLVGRMGQFLISLETVYSAAEPPVARYDDRLFQQAVLDEPACDHVVQPFRL